MNKIRAEHIYYSISDKQIIKDISIKVKKGQFVGIIGPNGSGKSTLLKMIYRILEPSNGMIWIDDTRINDLTYKETAQKLAVVAQKHDVNFNFTVLDMVLFGRNPYKKFLENTNEQDYQISEKALKSVGLLSYKERNFNTLSGGEQQRVILARAIAQETDCLILDEPTNHLDIKHQLNILHLIKSLKKSSLVALHDLNIAAQYSDYIYVLKNGEVVADGRPEDIITKEFIKDIYEVDAEVKKIYGRMIVIFNEGMEYSIL